MDIIKFTGNRIQFFKNFIFLLILTIFFLFVGFNGSILENFFVLISIWLIIAILLWVTFMYLKYLVLSSKGLEFNDKGIFYFGKFKISWEEILLVRIKPQTKSSMTEKEAVKLGGKVGFFSGGAAGGAIGGYYGSIARMSKNIELAIVPKDPAALINKQKGLARKMMEFNSKLSPGGEYLFLNIKPFIKAEINDIVLAIQAKGIKVEIIT
jgi:hypothetical protein